MRAVIAAALCVTLAGCSTGAAEPSPTSIATPSSVAATTTPARTSTVPASATPSATVPFATPTPITDLAQVFSPIKRSWRPDGLTLMVVAIGPVSETLIALPLGPTGLRAPATSIVEFSGAWDLSPDGSRLAVAVGTDRGVRLATYDLRTGASAWVTPPERDVPVAQPVWSRDGAFLYYASPGAPSPDFKGTIVRVGANGSSRTELATLDRFGGLTGITPDGAGLIWSRAQAGGSTEIFDLSTGKSRHLADVANVASIRVRQPRVVLSVGGCCAGAPGGSLELWDDAAMTSRVIAERGVSGSVAWGGAAWDPTGTRLAAVRYDATHRYTGSLVAVHPDTGVVEDLGGVLASGVPAWVDEGIVYAVTDERSPTAELKMLRPGGASVSLYIGPNVYRLIVVRP